MIDRGPSTVCGTCLWFGCIRSTLGGESRWLLQEQCGRMAYAPTSHQSAHRCGFESRLVPLFFCSKLVQQFCGSVVLRFSSSAVRRFCGSAIMITRHYI